MAPDARPKILSVGTSLATATVVIASVAGVLVGPSPNTVPLVACAAAYVAVITLGALIVERRQSGHWMVVALLFALGSAIVWISNAGSILVLMPLICITVIYFSMRDALVLTALLTAWIVFVLVRSHQGLGPVLGGASGFVAAAVFVLIFSRLVVKERAASASIERLAADVEAKNRQLGVYAAQIEDLATTQERNRIAREIHDGLGHYLTSAHMQLEVARAVIAGDGQSAAEHVARAQRLLHEGLGEVRRSVAMLRSRATDQPFAAALAALIEEARAAGIKAELHVGGAVRPLGPAVEFVLYRAAQEALTNVRRHAGADKAELRVSYGEASVELHVEDDGVGAANPGQGFGLVGVRERVELVGGEVDIATATTGGFALRVRVPA